MVHSRLPNIPYHQRNYRSFVGPDDTHLNILDELNLIPQVHIPAEDTN